MTTHEELLAALDETVRTLAGRQEPLLLDVVIAPTTTFAEQKSLDAASGSLDAVSVDLQQRGAGEVVADLAAIEREVEAALRDARVLACDLPGFGPWPA